MSIQRKFFVTLLLVFVTTFSYSFCEHISKQDSKHSFYLGGMALFVPKYDGASKYTSVIVPNFNYTYGQYLVISFFRGLGVNLNPDKPLRFNLGVRYKFWFRSSRSNRYKGLSDLKPYVESYAVAKYKLEPVVFNFGLYQSINKYSIGGFIRTGVNCFVKASDDLNIFFGPSIKLSDQKQMQTLYGVTNQESISSLQPVHRVNAGIEDMRFNLGLNYQISKSWNSHIMFSIKRVLGQAASSPIIENKKQYFGNICIDYKF